jgi:hypothetical protein
VAVVLLALAGLAVAVGPTSAPASANILTGDLNVNPKP